MDIKNKVALVTGGSKGIGEAIVREMVSQGAKVAFTYKRDAKSAEILVKDLKEKNHQVIAFKADASSLSAASKVVGQVEKEIGEIDILINNAGITRDRTLLFMTEEDWQSVIDNNLTSVFSMTKAVLPYLMKRKKGSIINISSVSALTGLPGQGNYAASKAGIIGLTRVAAKEAAKANVTVNAIAPGFIDTEMVEKIPAAIKNRILGLIPLQRIGKPEEVAQLVCYLSSEKARYITGQVITIDGGLTS